ncbi:carboxypeptidase-like regulatory domain-containing protein [Reichenbachiella sp. MALMAid0571]|uniref:carboxypeptidase-like regulatory domain-containing protein n=1 Tax=Reichenbachiella sp. MALMAid0571 TaxID=3143939 RepID=UPI0032DFCD10
MLLTEVSLAQQHPLDKIISVSFDNATIENVLDQISAESGVFFSYNSNLIQETQRFTLELENSSMREVITQLFIGTGVDFKVVNNQIVLFKLDEPSSATLYTVSGLVQDKYTKEPVVGVNVFIAGTLMGSSTNLDGVFKIENVAAGTFELAASHISYHIAISKVEIGKDRLETKVNFKLDPKVNQLKELKVVSLKYKEWEKYYSIFKQEFLGSTQNARKCDILNPEVLDFTFNSFKKSIEVKAYKPLIIINTALGYKLDYYLQYFEIGNGNTRSTGISNFKELDPKNQREERRWTKNRLKSYEGSLTHFLRSLVKNDFEQEGYKIFSVEQLPEKEDVKAEEIDMKTVLFDSENGNEKQLRFNNYLKIIYTKENESSAYADNQVKQAMGIDPYVKDYYNSVRRGVSLGKQTSYMKLNFPVATINSRGFFKEPLAVATFGYWSWERVAEYLPIEYEP